MATGSVLVRTLMTLYVPQCMAASVTAGSCFVMSNFLFKSTQSCRCPAFSPSAPGLRNFARVQHTFPSTAPLSRASRWHTSIRASSGVSTTVSEAASLRNSDPAAVCLVVGGGRGIGLAMVEDMLTRFNGRIFVTARDPSNSEALMTMQKENPNRLTALAVDVTNEASVKAAAEKISAETSGRVDVILNTAGILHDQNEPTSEGRLPERQLSQLTEDWFLHNMQVNCMGPMYLLKHFQPMLTATRNSGRPFSVFASLSARVGSIEDNRLGGWYSYRVSKAAHNQLIRTASLELHRRGCVAIALHPGTVNTGLSEPFQARVKPEKLFAVEKSAGMLLDVVDSLELKDTGSFFAYDRSRIPW